MKGTAIEWTDYTFNPWQGCTKVSPGCTNCYAAVLDKFYSGHDKPGHWGKGVPRHRNLPKYLEQPIKWNSEAERRLRTYHEKKFRRERVFSGSMCDVLDPEVPIEWFADFCSIVMRCPHLDWQWLTKRPEFWQERIIKAHESLDHTESNMPLSSFLVDWAGGKFPDNVWMGASVEDQRRADERIPALLKIPAKIRFLSVEPLLGPVQFGDVERFCDTCTAKIHPLVKGKCTCDHYYGGVDWVILGGESGRDARPCNIDHIRSIRDQCVNARVPVFVKQLGRLPVFEYEPGIIQSAGAFKDSKGGKPSEWPEDLRVRQFPPPSILTKQQD